ncbi:hypothetical protein SCHPADRAFT_899974 [Schizopora paradoxa]|uniref:MYND-type domain-containing protein n=1 Tax=Schizopora paradoxa TaxID=27342 RepID=A0A0H2S922_9AGAM|nr:hypothetical protein SCHPADRAFT_899974 [Schizopora paradoxa]
MSVLSEAYFVHHKPHLQKLWPDAIKWLRAILREGRPYIRPLLFETVFPVGGQLFSLVGDLEPRLIVEEGALDLALELWKGADTNEDDEIEGYTARPLLMCLNAQKGPAFLDVAEVATRLVDDFDGDGDAVIETILDRLSTAAEESKCVNSLSTTDLLMLLRILADSTQPSLLGALMSTDTIPIVVETLGILLCELSQTAEHDRSVELAFDFLSLMIPASTTSMHEAVDAGILKILLVVASEHQRYDCLEQPAALLNQFQTGIVFRSLASDMIASMNSIATSENNFDLPQVLQLATPNFQREWKRFEALLLEQAIVFELFDYDYAPERGACACCGKLAERKNYLKCAGCQTFLYCDITCQKRDWSRHKSACRKVDDESREYLTSQGCRVSRRLVTLQLNRYCSSIAALARQKNIPLDHLGVHFHHDRAPFMINVFDCRNVGKNIYDFDYSPIEPLVAQEVQRERTLGHPCIMLVVSHFGGVNVSYMVYLEGKLDPDAGRINENQGALYVDEKDNVLFPGASDVVEVIIAKSKELADNDWRTLWGRKPYEYLVEKGKRECPETNLFSY